jgi:hypothetical protein
MPYWDPANLIYFETGLDIENIFQDFTNCQTTAKRYIDKGEVVKQMVKK